MGRRIETIAALQIGGAVWLDIFRWNTFGGTQKLFWPFALVVWLVPFAWLLRSPDAFGAVRRLPMMTLVLWSVWYLVAANWSAEIKPSFGYALGTVSTTLAASWYAGTFGWSRLMQVVARTIAVFCVLGLVYRLASGPFFGPEHRFFGIGVNPTDTGRSAGVMVLAGVAGWSGQRRAQAPYVLLGLLVVSLAVAKTALVGLLFALFYIAYRSGGWARRLRLTALAAAGVLAAGIFVGSLTGTPTEDLPSSGPVNTRSILTFTGRTEVWRDTLRFFWHQPIVGNGTGSASTLYEQLISTGRLSWNVTTAHNLWFQSLMEHGLIGTALLVITAVTLFTGCRRRPNHARDALLMWLLVSSMTEALIQYPGLALLLLAGAAGMLTYPRPADISSVFAAQTAAGRRSDPETPEQGTTSSVLTIARLR